jgi:hypothetical protein
MNPDLEKLEKVLASEVNVLEDELVDRLATIMSGLDRGNTGALHTHSGIFWALTRVFGCYDQLAAACEEYTRSRADELTFVAALEVEHFLIRLRALLDEVAYAIRTRLPKTVRGLSEPGGPGPFEQKQFSITALLKFSNKHPHFCRHLTRLLENNENDIRRFIELRDDIAHFRAKAVVFSGSSMSVGFIGARQIPNTTIIEHSDLLKYIHDAMIWFWRFLQLDVVEYFRGRVEDGKLKFQPLGLGLSRITMPGIRRFKALL